MLAVILIYMKFRTESFEVNYPLRDTVIKGVAGERGVQGPPGPKGQRGVDGPRCKNIISNLETRGYLNLGGTSSTADGPIDSQLVLKGRVADTGRPFYKLKITDYSTNNTFPIMVGNNKEDATFYLEREGTNCNMVLRGDLKITGSIKTNPNSINTEGIFYNLAPKGIIAAFQNINDIPHLWAVCDGTTIEGFTTPDLRGKFIMGGGALGYTGAGGSDNQTLHISATAGGPSYMALIYIIKYK
jgi:hypothetical protein